MRAKIFLFQVFLVLACVNIYAQNPIIQTAYTAGPAPMVYSDEAQELKLWYNRPAKVWEEALPLGNSRLGAMVYGIPGREELQLNEETIWGGRPHNNDNPKAKDALSIVRQMIFDGKTREADKLINETFFTGINGMPFQTAGSVILNFPGHENFSDYYNELDLNRAVSTTRYNSGGVEYTRETFTSFADDVIIMQISANRKGAVNFEMEYRRPAAFDVSADGNVLVLEGKGSTHEGIPAEISYQIRTLIKSQDGKVDVSGKKIKVEGATVATLYISIGSNFIDYKTVGADYAAKASDILKKAIKKPYKSAIKKHTEIYNKQFDRFKLNLGTLPASAQKNTLQRITDFQTNQDPSLVTLLCQFGRYLLICSSQPGGQPANLQGIWCNSMNPAWDSKYTININAEMNYWPAEVTNLSETHLPFLQMVKELSETGRHTASSMYGAEGWTAHHNTDIWRVAGPVDFAAAGMWPTGGAWVSQHLWEHYLYNGDKTYLAEVYPVMKGAADFFLSFLVQHPTKGWMVVSPSVSPEQGPMSAGCTMDNQLVFDVLTKTAQANEILGEDKAYRERLLAMSAKLPPMQIGKHKQLQEWLEDVDDPKNEHRHVSHLYGLYPGNQISPYGNPELFEAARNSLIYRGDLATGWSIGWKVNLWARLLDGNHAYKIVNNMLTLAGENSHDGRTYPNMFTAHPPFQIDGNFGLTAGIAEMLIQSHDGAIHLLPAIPDIWPVGSVSGLKARGGFEVSMKWAGGQVSEVKIISGLGGNLRLRSSVPLTGKGLKEAVGQNPNILQNPNPIAKPLISEQIQLKGLGLKKVYEYDVFTEKGKTYIFTQVKQIALKDALKDKFYIGTALNANQITGKDTAGLRVLKEHFNSIVPENCMKSMELQPKENNFTFDLADKFVELGEKNDMFIIGHTLIWHSQLPRWFCVDEKGDNVSPEVLKKRMKNHINTVVGRYKGRIKGWDVVNEAILENGSYRKSKFYEILGEEFIPLAFQYAQEADPDAELYYNDYNEWYPGRRETVIRLIRTLKERGIRIDGIGMQGHIGMDGPSIEEYEQTIIGYANEGVKVMITEFDISILPSPQRNVGADIGTNFDYQKELNPYTEGVPEDVSAAWNNRMLDFFKLFMKHSETISRVTTWGITDGDSWKNGFPVRGRTDYPLLFNRSHKAKPTVSMIIDESPNK